MRKALTLSVPESFLKSLSAASRREGITRSQKALQLMQRQLAIEELNAVADRMSRRSRAQGIRSDEDVFERLR